MSRAWLCISRGCEGDGRIKLSRTFNWILRRFRERVAAVRDFMLMLGVKEVTIYRCVCRRVFKIFKSKGWIFISGAWLCISRGCEGDGSIKLSRTFSWVLRRFRERVAAVRDFMLVLGPRMWPCMDVCVVDIQNRSTAAMNLFLESMALYLERMRGRWQNKAF